jgi:drug/metabolite transporter (DMT)-like permease
VLTLVWSLAAAIGYGGADFMAGIAARRASVIEVTLLVYLAGLVTVLLVLPFAAGPAPTISALAWGAVSGSGCGAGALALAEGFRRADFSLAGPLSAVIGAGLAVLAGLLLGDRPASIAWAGVAVAPVSIFAVSASSTGPAAQPRSHSTPQRRRNGSRAGVGFGVAAGVGCAISLIGLAKASSSAGIWPVLAVEASALATVAVIGGATGTLRLPACGSRQLSVASGTVGAFAAVFYMLANRAGMLAIAAVVTSLFPAVTVGLAVRLEGERLGRTRLAGLILATVSVSLIALGGVA